MPKLPIAIVDDVSIIRCSRRHSILNQSLNLFNQIASKVARFVFKNLDRSRKNAPSLGSFSLSWKIYFPANSCSIFGNKPADKAQISRLASNSVKPLCERPSIGQYRELQHQRQRERHSKNEFVFFKLCRVYCFPASRGLSLSFLSFLPRRERPLLAAKFIVKCTRISLELISWGPHSIECKFRKGKKNSSSHVYVLHQTCNEAFSHL